MVKTKLTPVRYPGGKSNALKKLDEFFPKNFKEYREPFFGGGSVGLYLMQTHKDAVYRINDFFYPVYCFWKVLYERPNDMVQYLLSRKDTYSHRGEEKVKGIPTDSAKAASEMHKWGRQQIETTIEQRDEFNTACIWYMLNKTSYSGMSMIGSYAPLAWDQNFTYNCIENLPETSDLMHSVKEIHITWLDYSELLGNEGENVFIFLDPPYNISHSLYGKNGDMHDGFDHDKLAEKVKLCNHKWMITYNDDPKIRTMYVDYQRIEWSLQYTMKAAKRTSHGNLVSEREKKTGKKIILLKKQKGSASDTQKSGKEGKELLIMNYAKSAIDFSTQSLPQNSTCPVPTC